MGAERFEDMLGGVGGREGGGVMLAGKYALFVSF